MNISLIIPNYNGRAILEKNLPSVLRELEQYHDGTAELIIVDDCSTDQSVAFLKSFIAERSRENIILLENRANQGFSITVNKGAVRAKGEVLLLLNSDVSPEQGFLTPLLRHFADPQLFAVGCLDKSIEGDKTVLRGRGIGKWQRGFMIHSRGEVDKPTTLWVSGGSAAFRKSIWEKLEGFNTIYAPFYWEDIDLSYRALKAGYKIRFESESIVIHEHETGAIKSSYTEEKVKSIVYRNQFFFTWINASDMRMVFTHILWLPYHFVKAFLRPDKAFLVGFLKACRHFSQVISSRRSAQRLVIKSDSAVIASLYEV